MVSDRHHGTEKDPLISLMHRLKVPVNRETYLSLAHMGNPPEEWTAEHEADLPHHLQKPHRKEGGEVK
jgi:hypothetical protein